MTISFSYVYLNGLERRMVSSPSVDICVHLPRRAMSPLITTRTVKQCRVNGKSEVSIYCS